MNLRVIPAVPCGLAVLLLSATSLAVDYLPTNTAEPVGKYRVAKLQLSEGLAGESQQLRLIFRGPRCVQSWFLNQGYERINLLQSQLKLTADALQGDLSLQLAPRTSKYDQYATARVKLDLKLSGDKLAGKYEISTKPSGLAKYPAVKERKWNGTAQGEFLSPADPLAEGAGWPTFAGPQGNMSAPDGPPLVDDLNQAKPLWQSEAHVPVAYGNAPDSRYFWRAAGAGSGGGAFSPVVADGRVFIGFHRPSPASTPDLDNPYWKRKYPTEKDWLDDVKRTGMTPREQALVKAHFKPHADDVVVAIDARSGKTLWKTEFPMRSGNLQTHKHRGLSGVPLVAGGKVFYPNLHGRLYALDAKTGQPAWEWPKFTGPPGPRHRPRGPQNPSPLLLSGTLVWMRGKTYALDPETGQQKWVHDFSGHGMQPWRHNGRDYVLANSRQGAACIDVKTGETVWTNDVVLGFSQGYGNQSHSESIVAGDMLISFRKLGEKKPYTFRVSGWKISADGLRQVWEDDPLVPDENLSIAIQDGVAYCIGRHLVRCLDVQTGKHLGSITEEEFGEENRLRPRSNAWLSLLGPKLLLSPEGQHGKHGFLLFESDPKSLKQLGRFWVPPHATTTAYNGQPLVYPVVDGRIFMRGGDAIYCYDLRQ